MVKFLDADRPMWQRCLALEVQKNIEIFSPTHHFYIQLIYHYFHLWTFLPLPGIFTSIQKIYLVSLDIFHYHLPQFLCPSGFLFGFFRRTHMCHFSLESSSLFPYSIYLLPFPNHLTSITQTVTFLIYAVYFSPFHHLPLHHSLILISSLAFYVFILLCSTLTLIFSYNYYLDPSKQKKLK